MNEAEIEEFEKVEAQMRSIFDEVGHFAKKSPNDAINKFKLKFVNQLVGAANHVLGKKYRPDVGFVAFHEEELPTNSDVIFMFGQYLACLEKLRADNIVREQFGGDWFWLVDGEESEIRTASPVKIRGK